MGHGMASLLSYISGIEMAGTWLDAFFVQTRLGYTPLDS